jgi:hypothetical protein
MQPKYTPFTHFTGTLSLFFFWGGGTLFLPLMPLRTFANKKKHAKKTQPVSRSSSILYLMSYMKANGFERVRLFLLHVFLLVKNTAWHGHAN